MGDFDITSWLLNVLYYLPAIMIALSFHEWAHAYAAYRLGDPTARNLGRMTVNPMAHLDIVGIIMLLIVHFGWAKPVPINIQNFKRPRRDEIIVSLAGVGMNIVLAFVSMGVWFALLFAVPGGGTVISILSTIVEYIVVINLSLFIFNLIPVPPLDGYHVLECVLFRKVGYRFFAFVEQYGYIILIGILILNSRIGFLSAIVNWLFQLFAGFYIWLFGLLGFLA